MGATHCSTIRSNWVNGMSQLAELPTAQFRVRSYQRISDVLDSLRKLKDGGTATDVRNSYMDTTGERIAVSTVRSILFHLASPSIDLVLLEEDGNARWWSAIRDSSSIEVPPARNHSPGND